MDVIASSINQLQTRNFKNFKTFVLQNVTLHTYALFSFHDFSNSRRCSLDNLGREFILSSSIFLIWLSHTFSPSLSLPCTYEFKEARSTISQQRLIFFIERLWKKEIFLFFSNRNLRKKIIIERFETLNYKKRRFKRIHFHGSVF